jgi:hypothetical protein
MGENEIVLKEITNAQDDYKVVQKGDMVESLNKMNQVFHFIDLSYAKKEGIMFHGWIGYRSNEQLKSVLDGHFANIYNQYKFKNMVIEISKMSGAFNEANDWMATYFMPKLVSFGLQKSAVVLPANVFSQLAVDDWNEKVSGFQSRNFGSVNDALTWLRNG